MKNNIWFIIACVLVFCVGYNLSDTAVSFQKYKVGIVDVTEVMAHSTQVQELKRMQDKETEKLNTLISKAQNELLNETDKNKLLQKEASYRQEIETKKADMEKKYTEKLAKINDDIKAKISAEAHKQNYNLVLPSNMVIFGGDDITSQIVKSMKP